MRAYAYKEIVESSPIYPFVEDYLYTMLVIGRSNETHKRYQSTLRDFVLWCVRKNINELTQITKVSLKQYWKYLYEYRKVDGNLYSKGSLNSKMTSIKKFFEWCEKEDYIPVNIAFDLEIPKKPRGIPSKILMHDTVEHILSQPDISTTEGLRDRVIMEVLYATAIRRTECARLTISDIDFIRKEVRIRESKNGQPRVVPIYDRALDWIKRYLKEVRPQLLLLSKEEDDDTLFLSHEGVQFKAGTLACRVKRYIQSSGIDTRGSCHLFRHSTATQMLENGANVRYIQALLGHKDLNTTEIYMRVANKKLKEVHARTHPTTRH